jgi:glutaminyl-tRNA synthetase
VGRNDNWIDLGVLEDCVRNDLNESAPRAMAVLRPLKLVVENYPEGETVEFETANHPQQPEMGSRMVPFSRELYIERDDFMEEPVKGFKRLAPGTEVRLRNAYIVRCTGVEKDAAGNVIEVRCSYDPDSHTGGATADRKVKGVIHWVSAPHAVPAEVRLYDRLFSDPNPDRGGQDYKTFLNPGSLEVLPAAMLERSLADALPGSRFQFERQGYFCADEKDSAPGRPVFNRTVTLRDSWGAGK